MIQPNIVYLFLVFRIYLSILIQSKAVMYALSMLFSAFNVVGRLMVCTPFVLSNLVERISLCILTFEK